MSTRLYALAFLFAAIATSQAQGAILFGFDPSGTGGANQFNITTLDLAPGNALASGAIFGGPLAIGDTFELLYQARLVGGLPPVGGTGFGQGDFSGQITAVARFPEMVVGVGGTGTSFVADFDVAPGQPNYFQLYYNPVATADDLAGTGFDDGILILDTRVVAGFGGYSSRIGTEQDLDQYQGNSHEGQQSVSGSGSFQITAEVNYFDPNFFVSNFGGVNTVQFGIVTGSSQTPFTQVDPSREFDFAGVTPNIGTVNGVDGPDFQFQADGSMVFNSTVVPEPASLAVFAGLGVLGLGGVIRRRRQA